MLDLIMLAEWLWCTVLFAGKRLERSLVLAGGAVASGYTAYVAAPWLTRTLVPISSPVYQWALRQVRLDTEPVGAIHGYIPPMAASTTLTQVHWVTTHLLLALMFGLVTLAVFLCFLTTAALRETLWDLTYAPLTWYRRWCIAGLALTAGGYLTVITAVLLGNLAWLHDLAWLQSLAAQSLVIRGVGYFAAHVL